MTTNFACERAPRTSDKPPKAFPRAHCAHWASPVSARAFAARGVLVFKNTDHNFSTSCAHGTAREDGQALLDTEQLLAASERFEATDADLAELWSWHVRAFVFYR